MEALYDFFARPKDPRLYTAVRIALASSELIRQWSHGEIRKPETINYRTFKPERDGLFCAKIFGPTRDYECNCGKYKRMKHRGVICEKCGVEVIQSRVRRERMAHIDLAAPVAHIWYLKSLPSKIGNLLDMTLKNMERVLYFDSYVVTDPRDTDLSAGQIMSDEKYRENIEKYGGRFDVGIGAEAVRVMLENTDLDALYAQLRKEIRETGSVSKRQKLAKRMRIADAFRRSEVDPSWMIMNVIPVLPPDLRPLVPLEGGRFATSDLNDLYRRVINRNNRLRRLTDLRAPDIIVRNEKRMLQESVDVLFDNGRHGRVITGTNKRPLKSLSDTLKGKQGRFRQNLLGKRVDYSGRTVITTGPNLRLHECGLPKKMALELFKPFVYYRLEHRGLVSTVKSARKIVEKETPEVWDTLEEVVREYPILLNRAPTLHRLGFQSFEPTLIEGKAIQLHPLVCTAFNADFDGDQMAVHIPLSVEAQIEARVLMLSSNNILSPANGSPIIVPSQDIVLGIYYMTREIPGALGEGTIFSHPDEVRAAYDHGHADIHAGITVFMGGKPVQTTVGRILLWEVIPRNTIMGLRHIRVKNAADAKKIWEELDGTPEDGQRSGAADSLQPAIRNPQSETDSDLFGRIAQVYADKGADIGGISKPAEFRNDELIRVFALKESDGEAVFSLNPGEISPVIAAGDRNFVIFQAKSRRPEIPFSVVNRVMDKKTLRELVDYVYRNLGPKATVILSDRLKDTGYAYSTKGGISISIDAMIVPEAKGKILEHAEAQISEIGRQYTEGLITQGEKYNKVVDIWAKATDDVANEMMKAMKQAETSNPIFMMADSGARGSRDQMRQLAGMRGLMAKPSGEIIETPITANFREGLSVLQYFISTHGARKGLADTALKTANSGYLTRRLADVAQDCTVSEHNCGTLTGVEVTSLLEGGEVIQRLGERILGRTAAEDVLDPFANDDVLVKAGDEIDESAVKRIENAGLTSVKIRSVLTCRTRRGVCAKCYGRDLAHGHLVEIGQAVGILAAQSIGEPGTQLTMRTFHIGGTASRRVEQADIRARIDGTIRFTDLHVVPVNAASGDGGEDDVSGKFVVMNRRGGEFAITGDTGRELEKFVVIYGAHLTVKDGQRVKAGDLLALWDPFTTPIISEVNGTVKFGDVVLGKTLQEKVDAVTGKSSRTIIESKSPDVRPRISIKDDSGRTKRVPAREEEGADGAIPDSDGETSQRFESKSAKVARYPLPVNAVLMVEEGDRVRAGDVIAKLPRATTKTKDITGGLPRVAELFEVRKPKETAILSEINGYISISKGAKGKQKVIVTPPDAGEKKEYLIPRGRHINVYEGDYIKAGEPLIGGSAVPQDILNIKGEVALARYLVDEVQEVYRLQGVRINDKHIEVIVRQMMRRVKVTDPGDTDFISEEQVDKIKFEDVNNAVRKQGGKSAIAEPLILGITKASLSTDSFISAASFQETTKVLTEASIAGSKDYLRGLKENVIMGRLIPAGTGFPLYRNVTVETV